VRNGGWKEGWKVGGKGCREEGIREGGRKDEGRDGVRKGVGGRNEGMIKKREEGKEGGGECKEEV
jgi:hypothetical protein